MKEFIEAFDNAMEKNHTMIISSECEVVYSGRAESYLPRGDRIIIIKNDKTLLVHQPEGNNPINHMRLGANHKITRPIKDNKTVVIRSEHTKHKEHLIITIHKIHHYHSQTMVDEGKILVRGTEKDMSEMLYNNPEMVELGFKPLSREEHTKYGFIDVFGYDKNNILVVVECKRQNADLQAVTQLRRYVEKIMQNKGLKTARGILASPDISANAKKMLEEWGYEWKRIGPPRFFEKYDKKQKLLNTYTEE